MDLGVLLAQLSLEVQLIPEILDYPSLLSCLEILGIQGGLWAPADLEYLGLPEDPVARGLPRFQVGLLGPARQ